LLLALAVSFAVMPVPALADAPAVVITWERNWGSYGPADGQFSGPLDVAVDKWGHVYVTGVTDVADRRVQVFTSDGTFIGKTTEGWDGQPLSSPRSVACDRWGSVYVGQEGNGGLVNRYQALLTLPSPPFDESLG
ncbi:MAG: hypothetical protein JXP37_08745, partial [Coriobacteriia bacterium]|nr:hypothetical protein [Coriobacteriia bacterium]